MKGSQPNLKLIFEIILQTVREIKDLPHKKGIIMDINNEKKMIIPQVDGRALDFIKIAAAVFMVVDHINAMLLHYVVPEMMMVGRATFPLFCYAVAIAVDKTENFDNVLEKYGRRLLFLAFLVEPVSLLTRDIGAANVIFTLGLGAIFAAYSRQMKDWHVYLCFVLAAAAMSVKALSFVEFGMAGIALPAAILMIWRGRKAAWFFMLLLLATMNCAGYGEELNSLSDVRIVFTGIALMILAATSLPFIVLLFAKDLPQNGRLLSKYALHVFYPGHLLLLWGIAHFYLVAA